MGTSTATGLGTTVYVGAASILTGALLWNVSAGVGYPIFSGLTGLADHGMYANALTTASGTVGICKTGT